MSEIVLVVALRSRRKLTVSPPLSYDERIDLTKTLGVSFTRKLSVTPHVDDLLAACAKTLFALRTLRHHSLSTAIIQDIFQATVVAKLTYASQAWWGNANAADRARLESFLRCCVRLGFRSTSSPTLASLCDVAEDRLFSSTINNPKHLCILFFRHLVTNTIICANGNTIYNFLLNHLHFATTASS